MIRRDPHRFAVGDTVYRFETYRGRRCVEQEVLKVGRTLVYVGPPGETDVKSHLVSAFRIETGYMNSPRGYPVSTYIRTLAEHAVEEERKIARERLEGVGVRIEQHRGSGQVHLTPTTIHAIADLIEADTEYSR